MSKTSKNFIFYHFLQNIFSRQKFCLLPLKVPLQRYRSVKGGWTLFRSPLVLKRGWGLTATSVTAVQRRPTLGKFIKQQWETRLIQRPPENKQMMSRIFTGFLQHLNLLCTALAQFKSSRKRQLPWC